jgi:hypothetical protein
MKCHSMDCIRQRSRRHTEEELRVWGDLQAGQKQARRNCGENLPVREVSAWNAACGNHRTRKRNGESRDLPVLQGEEQSDVAARR